MSSQHNTIKVISRKDEKALDMFRRVLEDLPDLIAVVGRDYTFHYVNAAYAAIHGLSAEDFIGRPLKRFLGDEVFEKIVRPNFERCLDGEDVRYDEWFDFPGKGVSYMDVRYLPVRNGSDAVDRIVIILRDITWRKRAEDLRLDQEKLKTVIELAGTYNHEINNPLTSLRGYLELIQQRIDDPKLADYISKALDDSERIARVTKKIGEATAFGFADYPGGGAILDVGKEE